MTIGIYVLKFNGTNKVYVGQSIHIEERFAQHKRSLSNKRSNTKLQGAYNTYGMPIVEIILECSLDELFYAETEAIEIYDSIDNGFNLVLPNSAPIILGVNNPNSKYTEQDYYNVLLLLGIPGNSWKRIAELTNVSEYVISHISSLESHGWLKEKFPDEYDKVKYIRENGGRQGAFMQGTTYPKIVSPDGKLYDVLHVTNFAKEYGLLQSKLHEVLTGTRNTHKGWHLQSFKERDPYPEVISPEGISYIIQFKELATFCKLHNLSKSNFHSMISKKVKSCKGWKLK